MIEKTPGPYGAPLLDRDGASHRDAAHIGEAGGNALPLLCHGVLLVEEKVGARAQVAASAGGRTCRLARCR